MYGQHGGFEITPTFTEHADGSVDVDFDVKQGEFHYGNPGYTPEDFYEEQGQLKHVMQDTELEDPDGSAFEFDQAEYFADLIEADPRIDSAIEAGPDFLTDEQIAFYDNLVNSGNLDQIHEGLEFLLEQYEEFLAQGSEPQEFDPDEDQYDESSDQVQEWFDSIDDEVIDDAVDSVFEFDYSPETAAQLDAMLPAYPDTSPQAAILLAGIEISEGTLEVSDAMNLILDTYGEAQAFAAYAELMTQLQPQDAY